MKILILNMSPRIRGTSAMLGGMCAEYLEARGHRVVFENLYRELKAPEKLYALVDDSEALVLSGPCYINTYPADVTDFLEGMAAHPEILHGQALYGIIQGGMPYAHTHESGLRMLRIFAGRVGLIDRGGFVMGMGAMLNGAAIDRLPNGKKVRRQLDTFFEHISRGEPSPPDVYLNAQLKLPTVVARLLARFANRTIDRNMKRVGSA